jgi:hypothetical protein
MKVFLRSSTYMLLHTVMYENFLVAIIACIILLGPIKSIAFKEYLQLSVLQLLNIF